MRSFQISVLAGAVAALSALGVAQANVVYSVEVYTGSASNLNATRSNAAALFGSGSGATATFTYTGQLGFNYTGAQNSTPAGDLNSSFFNTGSGTISNYALLPGSPTTFNYPGFAGQNADFSTLSAFLGSSASINGNAYTSMYEFRITGATPVENLTITHDDGVGLYANNVLIPGTTTGLTSAITETISVPASASGLDLFYVRDNGSPSVLQVTVPEPASVTLLGVGVAGLMMVRRRQNRRSI